MGDDRHDFQDRGGPPGDGTSDVEGRESLGFPGKDLCRRRRTGDRDTMTQCQVCGGKIEPGTPFVLEGPFPSVVKRYFNFDFYAMDYYGACFHRSCYLNRLVSFQRPAGGR